MSVVSLTKTRNFARHCLPSPRCIDGSVYVARHSRGKHFNGLSSHTGGKEGGGGGGLAILLLAATCHRNCGSEPFKVYTTSKTVFFFYAIRDR